MDTVGYSVAHSPKYDLLSKRTDLSDMWMEFFFYHQWLILLWLKFSYFLKGIYRKPCKPVCSLIPINKMCRIDIYSEHLFFSFELKTLYLKAFILQFHTFILIRLRLSIWHGWYFFCCGFPWFICIIIILSVYHIDFWVLALWSAY